MTHRHIKTPYIRHLLADELYQSWRAWDGHHLKNLYGDDFNMVRFGLDTAFHRIDQRIVSGELVVVDPLHSMMREYLRLVDLTDNSALDPESLRDAQSQRTILHEQILRELGETRESVVDMVGYIREHLFA